MHETNGLVDLHLHTTRSDGHYTPQQLIDKVVPFGFRAIAISDHDEIGAIAEATSYAETKGLEVIPGVELSVKFRGRDIHILGYCFDPDHPALIHHLDLLRGERVKRARQIVAKLTDIGLEIPFEAVIEKAGSGSVGRPHIAFTLMDYGLVDSFKEAFETYIGDGKLANVEKFSMDISTALDLIKSAGGICSIAHPGLLLTTEDLMLLIKSGISGIEIVHPRHNEERMQFYRLLAENHGLLGTGGSDFHGGSKGEEALGKYTVPYAVVEQMKQKADFHQIPKAT